MPSHQYQDRYKFEVVCVECKKSFLRFKYDIAKTLSRGYPIMCKPCATKTSNISRGKTMLSIRKHVSGYLEIKTNEGWRRHHIYIMEQHLQRKLLPDEVVHHINEIKTDNRISNLQLMTVGEHTTIHNSGSAMSEESRIKIAEKHQLLSKLSPNDVITIRDKVSQRNQTIKEIANDYHVSRSTIVRIAQKTSWRNI